jgi:hypothetical protein
MLAHETHLYQDGLDFLEEYYGLELLANMLTEDEESEFHKWGKKRVIKWLKTLGWDLADFHTGSEQSE